MKRDMELVRKILFKIEDTVDNVAEYNLTIDGYSMEQVAYHCAILNEGEYIHAYQGDYASNKIYSFGVSRLTWEGHEFLDSIRADTVWYKTKEVISSKGLPLVFEIVKSVSTNIISGAINGLITF